MAHPISTDEKMMINAELPSRMTTAERLDEIADILATGILRLRKKTCKTSGNSDVLLDLNGKQSVHGHGENNKGERPCSQV